MDALSETVKFIVHKGEYLNKLEVRQHTDTTIGVLR